MAQGPEARFWQSLRNGLPKQAHATRIENRHGGGVPDVHIVWDGIPFWVELKVSKNGAVNLAAHQVAWHAAYTRRGGVSFILVKDPSSGSLFLFSGDRGSEVRGSGLQAPCLWSGSGIEPCFGALRDAALGTFRARIGFLGSGVSRLGVRGPDPGLTGNE